MTDDDLPPLAGHDAHIPPLAVELAAREAAQRATAGRALVVFVALPIMAVAVAWTLGAPVERWFGPVVAQTFGVILTLITVVGMIAALVAAATLPGEADDTAWQRRAAEQETAATAAAFELANAGKPYVLFLRSFTSEAGKTSLTQYKDATMMRVMERRRHARFDGDSIAYEMAELDELAQWFGYLDWLRAIGRRAPVILLGNTRLTVGHHDEIVGTGAIELTVQVQDWWRVFEQLEAQAALIVFYCEIATPELQREMRHLAASGRKYVISAAPPLLAEIVVDTSLGRSFVDGAAAILSLDDVAGLDGVLDRILPARAT